jgi:hypothetical protein
MGAVILRGSNSKGLMSALGQKRTSKLLSALPKLVIENVAGSDRATQVCIHFLDQDLPSGS